MLHYVTNYAFSYELFIINYVHFDVNEYVYVCVAY